MTNVKNARYFRTTPPIFLIIKAFAPKIQPEYLKFGYFWGMTTHLHTLYALIGLAFLSSCSDPQADAEKFRKIKTEDSLRTEIGKTRHRIDSLRKANDSLLQVLKSLDLQKTVP